MVNELTRRVQALAAVAQKAGCVGLGVEIEKECSVDDSKTSVKNVKAAL